MQILLLLLLFALPASSLTLADIRTDVRSLITDGQGTRQRFSDTELNSWLNEGQKLLDIKTLCNYKKTTIALAAGTTFYSLPSTFISVRRVTKDNVLLPELPPSVLDGRSSSWELSNSTATYYFVKFSTRGMIGVTPVPADSGQLGNLYVEYNSYSANMSDSSTPFDGINEFSAYQYGVGFYAAYKASVIDERDAKAKVYMDSFNSIGDIMKSVCIERPNYIHPYQPQGQNK